MLKVQYIYIYIWVWNIKWVYLYKLAKKNCLSTLLKIDIFPLICMKFLYISQNWSWSKVIKYVMTQNTLYTHMPISEVDVNLNKNKRPMGHIAHRRNQFKIKTFSQKYDYIKTLIWRGKKQSNWPSVFEKKIFKFHQCIFAIS